MKYSSRNSHIIAFVQQIRWPILVYPFHQSVCECVSWSKCVHLRMSAFEDVCVVRFKQNTKRTATRSITSGSINMIPTHTQRRILEQTTSLYHVIAVFQTLFLKSGAWLLRTRSVIEFHAWRWSWFRKKYSQVQRYLVVSGWGMISKFAVRALAF